MKHRNIPDKIYFRIASRITAAQDALRTTIYKMRGVTIGTGTLLSRVRIDWPHQVSIGNDCTIEPDVWFKHSGCLEAGPNIIIGDRVFIGYRCEFNMRSTITIGDNCLIAGGCKFTDVHHEIVDLEKPINRQPFYGVPIRVGNNVWLGTNVVVLKDVTIGDGAVVGAGAVVTKSIPANEIWGGIPAKRIGDRAHLAISPSHANKLGVGSQMF